jgi:hypothetical protein
MTDSNDQQLDIEDRRFVRWFSLGDVMSVGVMLVALGVTYGALNKDVASLSSDVSDLKQQRITPGAEIGLAQLQAKDASQDEQIRFLRQEMFEQRREILDGIKSINDKFESHINRVENR